MTSPVEGPKANEKRRAKGALSHRLPVLVLGGAALAGVGVWVYRVPLAEAAVNAFLTSQGSSVETKFQAIEFTHINLDHLTVARDGVPEMSLRGAKIGLVWHAPWAPDIESVDVDQLDLSARYDGKSFTINGLEKLLKPKQGPSTPLKLPARLHIGRATLTIDAPQPFLNSPRLELSGTAFPRAGSGSLDFVGHANPLPGQAEALTYNVVGNLLFVKGGLQLDGAAQAGGGPVGLVAGIADLSGDYRYEGSFSARVSLKAEAAKLAGFKLEQPRLIWSGARLAPPKNAKAGPLKQDLSLASETVSGPGFTAHKLGGTLSSQGDTGAFSGTISSPDAILAAFLRGPARLTLTPGADIAGRESPAITAWTLAMSEASVLKAPVAGFTQGIPDPLSGALRSFGNDLVVGFSKSPFATSGTLTHADDGSIVLATLDTLALGRVAAAHFGLDPMGDGPIAAWNAKSGDISSKGRAVLSGLGAQAFNTQFTLTSTKGDTKADLAVIARLGATPTARLDTIGANGLSLTLRRTARQTQITSSGEIELSGPLAGGQVSKARLPLKVEYSGDAHGFTLTTPSSMTLPVADWRLGKLHTGPLTLKLIADNAGLLRGTIATSPARGPVRYAGGLQIVAPEIALRDDRNATQLAVAPASYALGFAGTGAVSPTVAAATLAIRSTPTNGARTDIKIKRLDLAPNGTLSVNGLGVMTSASTIQLVDGALALRPQRGAKGVTHLLAEDARFLLRDTAALPMIADLSVTGRVDVGPQLVTAALSPRLAARPATPALGLADIRHDLSSNRGRLTFTQPEILFGPDFEPQEFLLALAGTVTDVAGPVSINAEANWDAATLTTEADIGLKGVSLSTFEFAQIEGLETNVHFTDLLAMKTAPHQTLTATRINPGVIIEKPKLAFSLNGLNEIVIDGGEAPFAGGTLSLQPAVMRLGVPRQDLTIIADQIDLAAALATLSVKDVAVTGTASGRAPIILADGKVLIDRARLVAESAGGRIQLRNPELNTTAKSLATGKKNDPVAMAFDALRDFNYKILAVEVSGDLAGDIEIKADFEGVNAQPLTGYDQSVQLPFKFKASVSGPLLKLLKDYGRQFTFDSALLNAAPAPESAPAPDTPAPKN